MSTSINQILKKTQRTPQEQVIFANIKVAQTATNAWKATSQPQSIGIISEPSKLKLNQKEIEAVKSGTRCLELLLGYYSDARQIPINKGVLNMLFAFAKRNLHPVFAQEFGRVATDITTKWRVPLTKQAQQRLEKLENILAQRETKTALGMVLGLSTKQSKKLIIPKYTIIKVDPTPKPKISRNPPKQTRRW